MARLNSKVTRPKVYTHEGGQGVNINYEQQLRRSVLACLLWENEFYEDGQSIAERIANTIPYIKAEKVAQIAIDARSTHNLRHVPLWIARVMAGLPKSKAFVAGVLYEIIQRPDELSEFLSMYWKDGKTPISAQVKKGLAAAFTKFDAYQLAKYDRETAIKLRDVLFMVHAKPTNTEQADTWKALVDGTLPIPNTWETRISALDRNDKRGRCSVWTELMSEKALGALAFLRNLRNMTEDGISKQVLATYLKSLNVKRVLPFRFIAAARAVPQLEDILEEKMMEALANSEKMSGKTIILIDVSGSMEHAISDKSDLSRMDAANALAILLREICDDVEVYTFSDNVAVVPVRHGFALADAITNSQRHGGTDLGTAIRYMNSKKCDRLIVFTDEQSHTRVPAPVSKAYMVNVASNQNGIGYGSWIHLDGFSEALVTYIMELER